MTQVEARRKAKEYQEIGIPVVAGAFPIKSWGGKEKCWALYLMTSSGLDLFQIEYKTEGA